MPTRRQDTNPDDSQFDLEMKRAAGVMRRQYKTAEVLRCQIVEFPDAFTAKILTPKQSYRYARKPLNASLLVGDYVSVLNPGGENSGKNWEILNVTIAGYASGVIDVNDFAGNIQIIPGSGIQVDSPLPNKIRITNTILPVVTGGAGVDVQRIANQNISTGSIAPISWDTENIDDDNFWSPLDPTKLVARRPGWHTFGAYAEFADNTNGFRTIEAVKNGNDTVFFQEFDPNGSVLGPAMQVSGTIYLDEGDYLEIHVFQNSGSILAINGRAVLARTAVITSYGTTYNLQSVQQFEINNTYQAYNTYQTLEATYGTYQVYQTVNQDITNSYPTVFGGSLGTYVSRFTPQSLIFGSYNPVAWEYEHIDEAQYWDSGQPTRLTARRTGWYSGSFRIHYATPGTTGTRTWSLLRKNGVDDVIQETGDNTSTVGGFHFNHVQQVAGTFKLDENDYIELVLQASNTITARAHGQLALLGSYDTVYQTLAYSYPTVYQTINQQFPNLIGGAVGAYVGRAADQGLVNEVFTPIEFQEEHIDEDDFWSASDPTKLRAPRDGWYASHFKTQFRWLSENQFNNTTVQIRKNGSEVVGEHQADEPPETGSGPFFLSQEVSAPVKLNQDDYLEFYAEADDSNLGGLAVLNSSARIVRIGSYDIVYQTTAYNYPTVYDFSQQNTYQTFYPNIQSPLGLGTYVARRTNQVIESEIETVVEFNYEHRDDDELWNSGLSSRFVANKDGWYVFSFTNQWLIGNEGFTRSHIIRKNGINNFHQQNSEEEFVNVNGVIPLNAGDFIENFVEQGSGLPRNLQAVGTMAFFGSYVTYPTYPTFIDQTVYATFANYETYIDAKYLLGETHSLLPNAIVKEYLRDNYDPDDYPASPDSLDDEFEGGGTLDAKWTAVNDPAGADAFNQTDFPGYLHVGLIELGTDNFANLPYIYQAAPSGAQTMTFICKAAIAITEDAASLSQAAEFAAVGIALVNSVNSEAVGVGMQFNDAAISDLQPLSALGWTGLWSGTTNPVGRILSPNGFVYFRLRKTTANAYTSANTYMMDISLNGIIWQNISQTSLAFTTAADRIAIICRRPVSQAGTPKCEAIVDFFRRVA